MPVPANVSRRDWTFRDAGLRSTALRGLNALGRRLAPRRPRFDPAGLMEQAAARSGLQDFGDDAFREGLGTLCASLDDEAGLHTLGRIAQRRMLVATLERRLRLVDHAKRHPEVRDEQVRAPFVVLGLPRTGTTLLSYLLDLDPHTRSLRSWESLALVPPPTLAGQRDDPRIAQAARDEARLAALNPPLRAMHPLGATLPTECVPLHMLDFRSLGFETQAMVPSYGAWLEGCDMRSAYAIHELALQVLQAAIPTGRWALKTPHHLWCLDALRARYPDAQLVWTHRDPLRVVPSVASLNMSFYRTWESSPDPRRAGREWNRKLHLATQRGLDFDRRSHDAAWCHHLHYTRLMAEPVEAVRDLYAHFGEELDPLHERRMHAWMADRPRDAFGRHRYALDDFGLRAEVIDEQYAAYRERFDVPRERCRTGETQ